MENDGLNFEIFKQGNGISYNDFNILPGWIDFRPEEVHLRTKLTKNLSINLPIITSPMDTVTEEKMAIAAALLGGIGIIHYNNTIEEQVRIVEKVKRYHNGFITEPITLGVDHKISDIDKIKKEYGFSGIPITGPGFEHGKLVGIVTNRDIDFEENRDAKLGNIMTPVSEMITMEVDPHQHPDEWKNKAIQLIKDEKVGKLPILNRDGCLIALISRNDMKKARDFPNSCTDVRGRLLVGAAISTHDRDKERFNALFKAGIDVVVIDAAQGNSIWQVNLIKWIKENYDIQIIGGNVVTKWAAKHLIDAGADALRTGMGSGAICTTQEVMACGRAQATAVHQVYRVADEQEIPVIADGGINCIGNLMKALSVGASVGMMGGMFAGTDESPGDFFYQDGIRVKKYRGMASLEAMELGGDKRYFSKGMDIKVAQGVSGTVVDKGTMYDIIPYIEQGLKLAFQDIGCRSIKDLHEKLDNDKLRFEKRTISAQVEGGIHDLYKYEKADYKIKRQRYD